MKRLYFNKPILFSGTGGLFKSGDCLLKLLEKKLESINAKFIKVALPPDKGMDISSYIIQ